MNSSTASDALMIVGFVGLVTGGVLLIVYAARRRFRRTWKRWTAVSLGGLALLLVGVFAVMPSPKFELTSCNVAPREAISGESVSVTVDVENVGEAKGFYTAVLVVDGAVVDSTPVLLPAKERETISFTVFEDTPGIHEIKIGKLTDSFEVLAIPRFEIVSCSVAPWEVMPGESVTVTATVENTGAADGVYQAILIVDGVETEVRSVPLVTDHQETISFTVTEDLPGIHTIELGQRTTAFEVLKAPQFEVLSIGINPNPVKIGQETTVSVMIKNVGKGDGTYTASLVVDGVTEQMKDIELVAGAASSIFFPMTEESPGSYTIEVADQEAILDVVEPVRLDTGTFINGDLYGGKAKLTVENGLDLDAVVILSLTEEPDTPLVAVYIQADDSYTIKRIKGGTYILYFCLGKDWDENSKRFMADATYKRFEDDIKFVSSSSRYSVVTVTLHPVVGGSAATESLSEDEFPEI